jgi:hypothetical protein
MLECLMLRASTVVVRRSVISGNDMVLIDRCVSASPLILLAAAFLGAAYYGTRTGILPGRGSVCNRDDYPRIFAVARAAYCVVGLASLIYAGFVVLGFGPR